LSTTQLANHVQQLMVLYSPQAISDYLVERSLVLCSINYTVQASIANGIGYNYIA